VIIFIYNLQNRLEPTLRTVILGNGQNCIACPDQRVETPGLVAEGGRTQGTGWAPGTSARPWERHRSYSLWLRKCTLTQHRSFGSECVSRLWCKNTAKHFPSALDKMHLEECKELEHWGALWALSQLFNGGGWTPGCRLSDIVRHYTELFHWFALEKVSLNTAWNRARRSLVFAR